MNFEQTICDAVTKSIGRKNAAIIVAMVLIFMLAKEVNWEVLALIGGLAMWVSLLQFTLDCVEVWRTGRDLPDSGATTAKKPTIPPAITEGVKALKDSKWEVVKGNLPMKDVVAAVMAKASAPEATKEVQAG